jgi:cation channel sperm-associated protein 2
MGLYEYKYWAFAQFFVIYNAFIIFLLYTEIYLKVIDDYRVFLRDGWQFTDLLLTVIVSTLIFGEDVLKLIGNLEMVKSTIPEIAEYTGTNSQFKVIRLIRVFKLVIRSRTSRVIILTIMQAFKVHHF